ncbi:MAG: thioredoxin [Methanopyri archaeon]|nr:thioredoxin [Methanopyri archaeon]
MGEDEKSGQEGAWPVDVPDLTDDSFESFITTYGKVVIDCWAEWCGPCKMMGPVIDKMAEDHKGSIAFAKLNVDKNSAVATKFAIMAIPAFLVFKDGEFVNSIVGALPQASMEAKLDKLFG